MHFMRSHYCGVISGSVHLHLVRLLRVRVVAGRGHQTLRDVPQNLVETHTRRGLLRLGLVRVLRIVVHTCGLRELRGVPGRRVDRGGGRVGVARVDVRGRPPLIVSRTRRARARVRRGDRLRGEPQERPIEALRHAAELGACGRHHRIRTGARRATGTAGDCGGPEAEWGRSDERVMRQFRRIGARAPRSSNARTRERFSLSA